MPSSLVAVLRGCPREFDARIDVRLIRTHEHARRERPDILIAALRADRHLGQRLVADVDRQAGSAQGPTIGVSAVTFTVFRSSRRPPA